MHSSLSPVSKYRERYGLNGLQATTVVGAPCSIPTKTQHVQTRVQREAVCLLYSLMHSSSLVSKYKERYALPGPQATQMLLVAYQPRIGRPPQDIRTACANVCLE